MSEVYFALKNEPKLANAGSDLSAVQQGVKQHAKLPDITICGFTWSCFFLQNARWRSASVAIKRKIIDEADRFSPHDLKRMGVSYTKGSRADKQEASGHRYAAMMDIYDHLLPLVNPAGE